MIDLFLLLTTPIYLPHAERLTFEEYVQEQLDEDICGIHGGSANRTSSCAAASSYRLGIRDVDGRREPREPLEPRELRDPCIDLREPLGVREEERGRSPRGVPFLGVP